MAKLRTTKNQIHPQRLQFGGLNLPFLNKYQDLNNQWGNFWRGNDYFGATGMLNNTINSNQSALNSFQDTQNYNKRTGASAWGDTALMYSYRNDWNRRNPNATADEKARFDNYNDFYYKYEGKAAPEWDGTSTLEAGAPGSSVSDYNAWKKGRESIADQAKKEWSANNSTYNTMNAESRKQMGQAMTNSAAGIFSGLNYMNSYTPPETINMQQGSKGVMYSQMGGGVGPALSNYTVSSENPDKTINAFQGPLANYINFQGKGKILPNEFNTVINNNDVLEALTGVQGVGKAALKKLTKAQLLKLIVAKNVPNAGNVALQQGLQEAVGSWQDGGTVPFKAYGLTDSPMMRRHGALQPEAGSRFVRWKDPRHAYNAINDLLFSGNSKIYSPTMKVSDALKKYTGGDYVNKMLGNKKLKDLDQRERDTLTQFIMQKENSASQHSMFDPIYNPDKVVGPSITDYQVTSRQEGGNVNLEGYTPGYPSMNNDMNEIPSGDITMEQTPIPLLAIGKGGADNGLLKVLQPQSKGYNFKSKSTVEIPLEQQQQDPTMAKYGKLINALNNYNNGGYIRQYNDGGTPTDPISIFKSLKSKGYLQEYNENTFNKLSAEEQDMLFKAAAADFNSKQTVPQGQVIQEIRRPLTTQLDSSMMVPNQMSFDDAFAQARAQGLQQFEFNGNLFNTKIDPNAKASSGKSNSMRVINNSQAGLARDLIGNRQFGGYLPYFQGGGNVRRAVYQAANQEPPYKEPGIDTRFMPDARFNRPSIYGNSAIYQGAPNQLQSASMIPTINPTVVEPMSGLGFNRDKLAAQMNVSNNVKLAKGGTQKVAAYQQMLKAAGYNIEVDGAWGPKTQAAYEAYTGKKAPSKTAVNSGKAKVASNIIKNSNYGYNGEVVDYFKKNNIDPSGKNVDAFYNNNLNIPINNNNVASNINKSKRFKNQRQGSYNEDVSKRLSSLMESDEYKKASKLERAGMLVEIDPISALQLGLNVGNLTAGLRNVIIPGIAGKSMSDAAAFSSIYSGIIQGMAGVPTGADIANYDNAINNPEVMNPYIKNNVLAPTWIDAIKYIPKFQFGGSVNDEHSIPVFSSNLEDFGLTELQTEKDEVAFMPDGSIVDVKAKELHKKQDKHNVSDIMQSGTYVFSNDPKMKFGIKSKIGGVELGEMKLGKSVFKYKENEITPGPEDIMLKTMFFNNSKKELTTADIAKNVKKNLPIIDLKNDYFADRAIAENKDQRLEYLSILKAFNEFKKPKSRSIPKAQYGMPIQPTQNGLDGVMGYGDKQMDPFKRMDNNMVSMWNMPQPKLPTIPRMYENGGTIPQAQFGWLADGIDAIGGWSRRAKRDQERKNAILAREAQGYRDELQRGVNTAGGIGVGTNLATYAAALNVPLQKYDDQSEQMSLYNAAANRAAQRLEASKYTASQGIGGASSLARYSNPINYGDYLSKVQSQSDDNISKLNQAIADLDMQRANANVGFISNRNAGRNQSLNARDTQLYNANVQGIGNVGRSAQEAIFNTADTKYRLGNEKMAYDAYLTDKAEAAKQAKQQQIRGYANDIGLLGLTYATGGLGGKKLFDKGTSSQAGQPSFTGFNPSTFNGPNFQNPAQMSPIEQRFNPNYDGFGFTSYNTLVPAGTVNRNGVNNGNFMNRNTDNWDYNFLDVNTWRFLKNI